MVIPRRASTAEDELRGVPAEGAGSVSVWAHHMVIVTYFAAVLEETGAGLASVVGTVGFAAVGGAEISRLALACALTTIGINQNRTAFTGGTLVDTGLTISTGATRWVTDSTRVGVHTPFSARGITCSTAIGAIVVASERAGA